MSLKLRLIWAFVVVVLITTLSMGALSFFQARSIMLDRTTEVELPAQITQIKNTIESQINELATNAEILANNPMILAWAGNGFATEGEKNVVQLLANIKERLKLDTASWADRQTANYWNQDGFLRTLTPERDGWFFNFTQSSNDKNVSIYRSKSTGEVKLFVNYQNKAGRGLAGFGMNLDKMVNYLNGFSFDGGGFVYLISTEGVVKIHRDESLLEESTIHDLYGDTVAEKLLAQSELNIVMAEDAVLASQYIPAMGWLLVAEIPNKAVFGSVQSMGSALFFMGVLLSLITVVAAFFIGAFLVKQLEVVANNLKEIGEGDGDLNQRLSTTGPVELANIGSGFNRFVTLIHSIVQQVSQTSNQLSETSDAVKHSAAVMQNDASSQNDSTSMVVSAIHEVEASVREVSQNAAEAASSANKVNSEVQGGLGVVSSTQATIESLAKESEATSIIVQKLADNSVEIGGILDVIRNISEQTNLLALNAAIESARAGEQGRGFAVVADEVRNLAKRTAQSTDEIQEMINQLRSEADKALQASKLSQEKAYSGVESMQSATKALNDIAVQANKMNDLNCQVATATEQQLVAIEEVGQNVVSIQSSIEEGVTTSKQLAQSSTSLQTLAVKLNQLVGGFKI
ncbi:methyl-accepting chemotaxis protein [Marinomonas agarivorans]|nr:methyl-accepting chemotaxis protein [Marinomonas agarivorans]